MLRTVGLAFLLTFLAASEAIAQTSAAAPPALPNLTLVPRDAPPPVSKRGLQIPITDYVDDKGTLQRRRGIIFGKEVGPNALIGLGVFDRAPRVRSFVPEPEQNNAPRKSRGVAVGIKLGF